VDRELRRLSPKLVPAIPRRLQRQLHPKRSRSRPQVGEGPRSNRHRCCHKRKWGPALLPAPTAPSEGSAGVRNLVKNPKAQTRSRSWLTSSGVASDRTTPSCEEPDWPTEATTRRITVSFDPSGLAMETEAPGQNRPMFCGPSWVDHSWRPA